MSSGVRRGDWLHEGTFGATEMFHDCGIGYILQNPLNLYTELVTFLVNDSSILKLIFKNSKNAQVRYPFTCANFTLKEKN